MRREGVPNSQHAENHRGESNLGTSLGEKIEGGRAKLTCWDVGV